MPAGGIGSGNAGALMAALAGAAEVHASAKRWGVARCCLPRLGASGTGPSWPRRSFLPGVRQQAGACMRRGSRPDRRVGAARCAQGGRQQHAAPAKTHQPVRGASAERLELARHERGGN
jgi:hypothetical protein